MKKFNETKKSKAFTLVELLIVLIIIGILAGMMMLNSMSATAKAEAVKIVSDMRNIKSASLLYYADNMKWPVVGSEASLDQYLDQKISDGGKYKLTGTSPLLIEATVSGDQAIKDKLKGMASESALFNSDGVATYDGSGNVYMVIHK